MPVTPTFADIGDSDYAVMLPRQKREVCYQIAEFLECLSGYLQMNLLHGHVRVDPAHVIVEDSRILFIVHIY